MTGELEALIAASVDIGGDPSMVQGAGGNVSLKQGGTIWVKASGKWLAHAGKEPMLVPLDLARVLEQLCTAEDDNQAVAGAVLPQEPPLNLRPSIETTLHAVVSTAVVLHVHCVRTLSFAVQADGQSKLDAALAGLNWSWIPYARPGLALTRAIERHMRCESSLLVLANHGLVVGASTVAAAEALLQDVRVRLDGATRPAPEPDLAGLTALAAVGGYRLPKYPAVHDLATVEQNCMFAATGSLYPDHVVFLGHSVAVLRQGETPLAAARRVAAQGVPEPALVLVPGKGALLRDGCGDNGEEMALSLSLVVSRIPAGAALSTLTMAQEQALVNWDAEKYRRTLNG